MYEDEYDDSQRLDEMLTAEDYNRFEEEQLAKDNELDNTMYWDEDEDPWSLDPWEDEDYPREEEGYS